MAVACLSTHEFFFSDEGFPRSVEGIFSGTKGLYISYRDDSADDYQYIHTTVILLDSHLIRWASWSLGSKLRANSLVTRSKRSLVVRNVTNGEPNLTKRAARWTRGRVWPGQWAGVNITRWVVKQLHTPSWEMIDHDVFPWRIHGLSCCARWTKEKDRVGISYSGFGAIREVRIAPYCLCL